MSDLSEKRLLLSVAGIFGIAAATLLFAWLLQPLNAPHVPVALVNPAAGVALCGLLLLGRSAWPGIFLGALLASVWVLASSSPDMSHATLALVGCGIAVGACLQALLGAALIHRFVGFPTPPERIDEVVKSMVLGGPLSCLTGSAIAIASLVLGGLLPADMGLTGALDWWVGDGLGVLLTFPLVAVWQIIPEKHPLRTRLSVILPMVLIVLASALLYLQLRSDHLQASQLQFERRTDPLILALNKTKQTCLDSLYAIEGLFMASQQVDRHEFRQFVKGSLRRLPAIQALEWVPRVTATDKENYQEQARKDGLEGFQMVEKDEQGRMVPVSDRDEYFPVFYLEPLADNQAALGFDLGSNPARRQALLLARDTGQPVASARIRLIQDTGEQFGVLIVLPIYRTGLELMTIDQRRQQLRGYALGVFRIGDMVTASWNDHDLDDVHYRLRDMTALSGSQMLLSNFTDSEAPKDGSSTAQGESFGASIYIDFAGRLWHLEFFPTDKFLAEVVSSEPRRLFLGGLLIASMLGAFILIVVGRSAMVAQLVKDRTADLSDANAELARSVEERRQMVAALRESEAKARTIVDTAVDAIITIDEHGIVLSFNNAAERIFGYVADEVIGKNVNLLQPEPFHSAHDSYLRHYIETGQKKIIGIGREVIGRHKDGHQIPIDLAVSEVELDNKRLFTGIIRDISDRKQAEKELLKAKEQAEAASQAKSDFLASMSHEIRTPMNAIIGMAELLEETPLTQEQHEYVHVFQSAGETLLSLINDILDISKLEAGQLELEQIDFNLREVLEKTCEILALRAHKKGLELACHLAPDTPERLQGDPLRLRQVLVNLIGNAIKFTEQGEIVVEVGPELKVPADQPAKLLFSVRDTGIGIPREKQQTIFERFTQVDASTTRQYGGTGLGLNISQRIVEAIGGRIWVESDPGKGSTFFFTGRFSPAQSHEAPDVAIDLSGMQVLVVDDCAANRLVLRETLARWGAGVTEAEDGRIGLAKMELAEREKQLFDLVLLDCRMPEMDGFEVARQIKQSRALAGTTVMMLTSDNRAGDIAQARQLGMAAYMVKPIKRRDLQQAISNVMQGEQPVEVLTTRLTDAPESRPLHILLVDDSEDNRLLVTSFLKKLPYRIDTAENGEIAVEKFQTGEYDLVLMDMQMPVMDGYAASRKIRQWERDQGRAATPIIALTAFAQKDDAQKSLDAGCDDHLTKPIKKAVLLKAIERHAGDAAQTTPATQGQDHGDTSAEPG